MGDFVGARDDARGVEGREVASRVNRDSPHRMVLEVVTNGKVDPFAGRGKSDTGAATLHRLELLGRTDARVEQNPGRGQGSGSENHFSTSADVDDLNAPVFLLDLDASDAATTAHHATDLGVEAKAEVVEALHVREVRTHRTGTNTIGHRPRRVAVRHVLLVGLFVLVD